MAPPLRTEADREALLEGLADGTIEAIATDHAPHHRDEKDCEFASAANGVVGLETLLPLTLELVRRGVLDLPTAVARVSSGPAGILNLDVGTLEAGRPADVVVVDPDAEWEVGREALLSKSKNTPFEGWRMRGRAVLTVRDGKIVHGESELASRGGRA